MYRPEKPAPTTTASNCPGTESAMLLTLTQIDQIDKCAHACEAVTQQSSCRSHPEASRFSAASARLQRLEQTRAVTTAAARSRPAGCGDVWASPSWVADVLASYRGDSRLAHIYVRSDGPGLSLTRDQLREQVARRA